MSILLLASNDNTTANQIFDSFRLEIDLKTQEGHIDNALNVLMSLKPRHHFQPVVGDATSRGSRILNH